jgi:dTMP kinase
LDVSQNESFSRKSSNRDRFEKNKDFSNKISKTYRKIAKKRRWKIVDATKSKQEVHEDIMRIFGKKIGI